MKTPIILLCGQAGAGKSTVADILAKQQGFEIMGQADAIKELARTPFGLTQDQLYGPSESRNAVVGPLNVPGSGDFFRRIAMQFRLGQVDSGAIADMRNALAALSPTGSVMVLNHLLADFLDNCGKKADAGELTTRYILQQLGTEVGRTYDQLIWTRATVGAANKAIAGGARGVVIADGRFLSEILTAADAGATVFRIDSTSTLVASTHASEAELGTIPGHFFDVVIENDKAHGVDALAEVINDAFRYIFDPMVFNTCAPFPNTTEDGEAQ